MDPNEQDEWWEDGGALFIKFVQGPEEIIDKPSEELSTTSEPSLIIGKNFIHQTKWYNLVIIL